MSVFTKKTSGFPIAFNQLDREGVGIAPGCGDSVGSLRSPAHASPAEAAKVLTTLPSELKTVRISGWGTPVLANELNDFMFSHIMSLKV